MKKLDFNFFSDHDNFEIPLNASADYLAKKLLEQKERAFLTVIEELEGKVPTKDEVARKGRIEWQGSSREIIYWDNKPVLVMDSCLQKDGSGKVELKFAWNRLYSKPV